MLVWEGLVFGAAPIPWGMGWPLYIYICSTGGVHLEPLNGLGRRMKSNAFGVLKFKSTYKISWANDRNQVD